LSFKKSSICTEIALPDTLNSVQIEVHTSIK